MKLAERFAFMVAAVLALTANTAWAEETRTVVLDPHKHAGKDKFAFAGAGWVAVKADKEAAVVVVDTDTGSAVRVVKGTVTVRNLADHSVIRLGEGCAYETVVRTDPNRRQPEAFLTQAAETIALFENKSNTSYLYRMESTGKLKAEILTPPINQSYSIGDIAASRIAMSRLVGTNFPPTGVVVWHPPTPVLAEQGNPQ